MDLKVKLPPLVKSLAETPIDHFMTKNVAWISHTCTLERAIQILLNKEVSSLPVVDKSQKCIGIISEKELMLQAATGNKTDVVKYKSGVDSVGPLDPFKDVIAKLYSSGHKSLPVLDQHDVLIGIIARRDILKTIYLYDHPE